MRTVPSSFIGYPSLEINGGAFERNRHLWHLPVDWVSLLHPCGHQRSMEGSDKASAIFVILGSLHKGFHPSNLLASDHIAIGHLVADPTRL